MTIINSILLFTLNTAIIHAVNYFVDSHPNCNNVYLNLDVTTYLGKTNNTSDCIDLCIAYGNSSSHCDSYTYFNAKSINNSQQCYGYINNVLWVPFIMNNTDCGRIIYSCKSDTDCYLNGKCNQNTGNCTCSPGFNGYKCGNLTLLPATKSSGYHMIDNGTNTSSWGGSIQYNKQTNVYSMFVAEMYDHCGIGSWKVNSQIMYAESNINEYNSNYKRVSKLLVPFAHSPGIIYAPNTNEYVLIYVHNQTDNITPSCTLCTDGTTSSQCNTHQNMTEITSIRYINSLNNANDINNWSDPIYLNVIGSGDSNFAAQINIDGSLIGMIRKSATKIYLITASNWKDNTTYIMHNDMNNGLGLFPYLPEKGTEDMYVYKDCNGNWHALFHNKSPDGPNYTPQYLCGGHAFSKDGINWIYTGWSFSNEVVFTNGEKYIFARRERPHLVFDMDKCTPVALTSAVEYKNDHDGSYTFIQPIKH